MSKKFKVRVEPYRGIRDDALCENCDWEASANGNIPKECRDHVAKTGHKVARTYGSNFNYYPISNP